MATQLDMNRLAWPWLVKLARTGGLATYSQLAAHINDQAGTQYTPYRIGQMALDHVERWCLAHRVPDLTALVVHGEGDELPGRDFFRRNGIAYDDLSPGARRFAWSRIRDAVYRHAWPDDPPF